MKSIESILWGFQRAMQVAVAGGAAPAASADPAEVAFRGGPLLVAGLIEALADIGAGVSAIFTNGLLLGAPAGEAIAQAVERAQGPFS